MSKLKIFRQEKASGRITYHDTGRFIEGLLIPASAQFTAFVGGVYGKTYRLTCRALFDVQEGDQLTGAGVTYSVNGVQHFREGLKHTEAVLVEPTS